MYVKYIYSYQTIKILPVKFHYPMRSDTQSLYHLLYQRHEPSFESSQWATFNNVSCRLFWEPTVAHTKIPSMHQIRALSLGCTESVQSYPFASSKSEPILLRFWIVNKMSIYRCGHIPHLFPAIANRII
jgi:hypothetical protein